MSALYLDAVSPNWSAIVWGEYDSAFPVTLSTKASVEQVIQPIFTREFKVLGADQSYKEILGFLSNKFKNVDLRIPKNINEFKGVSRTHQMINLDDDFESNYSKNAKRLVKKSEKKFNFQSIESLELFFQLINVTLVPKINEFTDDNIDKLNRLMDSALSAKCGDCIAIYNENNEFVGAGFFFIHQSRITYLKGAATNAAKKEGAMYGLINFALQKYKNGNSIFDFGGSEIENVADFYRKFGAINRNYYHYRLNNLPFWYRWLKKIRLNK